MRNRWAVEEELARLEKCLESVASMYDQAELNSAIQALEWVLVHTLEPVSQHWEK